MEELEKWKSVVDDVSHRWGAVQLTELQHKLAGMRKQLGELWELCSETINPKIQKRINDLTVEIQIQDSLMADVIAKQGTGNDN